LPFAFEFEKTELTEWTREIKMTMLREVILSSAMNTKTTATKRSLHNNNNRPPTSSSLRSPPHSAIRRIAPEDQTAASPSVSSVLSSRSRAELSLSIQKQLAIDIETAGGIKAFVGSDQKLCKILTDREDIYGKRADPFRKVIRKKVYHWQLLERKGTYVEKVLNRLEVRSYAIKQAKLNAIIKKQQQQTNNKRRNQCETSSLFGSSSSSGSSSDSSSSSLSSKVVAAAQKHPPAEDCPPRFIEAPTSKQRRPKPKLSIESFPPPVESNMNTPKSPSIESFPPPVEANMNTPKSPTIPLPRDTGKYQFADCCLFFLLLVLA
jgi:hypothetical protein